MQPAPATSTLARLSKQRAAAGNARIGGSIGNGFLSASLESVTGLRGLGGLLSSSSAPGPHSSSAFAAPMKKVRSVPIDAAPFKKGALATIPSDVAHEKERQRLRLQERIGKKPWDAKKPVATTTAQKATPRAASPTGRRNRSGLSASKSLGFS